MTLSTWGVRSGGFLRALDLVQMKGLAKEWPLMEGCWGQDPLRSYVGLAMDKPPSEASPLGVCLRPAHATPQGVGDLGLEEIGFRGRMSGCM